MRFDFESARQQHPEARLIPSDIWRDPCLFNENLPNYLLPLMQAPNHELPRRILDAPLNLLSEQEKTCTWLAIILSHPDLSVSARVRVGYQLNLNDELLFIAAAAFGDLELMRFLGKRSPASLQRMIEADDYAAFRWALKNADFKILDYLEKKAPPHSIQYVNAAYTYTAVCKAVESGSLRVLLYLEKKAPHLLSYAITANWYNILNIAAANGHDKILEYLISRAPYPPQEIAAYPEPSFFPVVNAAANGHLKILFYLEATIPGILARNCLHAFRAAAANGHLGILFYLARKLPELLQDMIAENDYEAFRMAAANGHLGIVLHLLEEAPPDSIQKMVSANNYHAFLLAFGNGHLDVVRCLVSRSPRSLQDLITTSNYSAFCEAAEEGNLDALHYLEKEIPGFFQNTITAEACYSAFQKAAGNGKLDVLEYLEKKVPHLLQNMIAADNYYAFRLAAQNGQRQILDYLESKAPNKIEDMIRADHYGAFYQAARQDRLDVLRYLEAKTPHLLQDMIAVENYIIFHEAVGQGHLEIMLYLEEKASNRIQDMLQSEDYAALHSAYTYNRRHIAYHLLSYPTVFSHAERHDYQYGEYVNRLMTEKLTTLREQKNAFSNAYPNDVFDVENETEAELLFYMARNLVRRNDQALQEDLDFLLTIPTVHHLVTVRGFGDAVEQSELDLRALAQYRESSMTALTSGEKARLNDATQRYGHRIRGNEEAILQQLREQLEARYGSHPATLIKNGETIQLPLSWSDFQALGLNEKEQQNAIAAYAQNKDHTAWRFLLKPNPWIHEKASHACSELGPNDTVINRWSAFEDYKFELCLFYLGAIDEESSHTGESQLEEFITALALIQRAHNWDHFRPKLDCTGKPMLTARGERIFEEYDDLQQDNPSCSPGIERRLYQSLPEHVLFNNILTTEIIEAELREFIQQHFKEAILQIPGDQITQIKQVWKDVIGGEKLTDNQWSTLKILDISQEKQNQFTQSLESKYGQQWTADPRFTLLVKTRFALQDNDIQAHVMKFPEGGEQLRNLFNSPAPSPARLGFFSSPTTQDEWSESTSEPASHKKL